MFEFLCSSGDNTEESSYCSKSNAHLKVMLAYIVALKITQSQLQTVYCLKLGNRKSYWMIN